jgi:hypothetical protein
MGDLGPLGDGTSVDYGQEILADAELSLDDLLAAGNCSKQVLPLPLPPIGEKFEVGHGNQKCWTSVESHEFLVLVGSEAFRRQYKAPNALIFGRWVDEMKAKCSDWRWSTDQARHRWQNLRKKWVRAKTKFNRAKQTTEETGGGREDYRDCTEFKCAMPYYSACAPRVCPAFECHC